MCDIQIVLRRFNYIAKPSDMDLTLCRLRHQQYFIKGNEKHFIILTRTHINGLNSQQQRHHIAPNDEVIDQI